MYMSKLSTRELLWNKISRSVFQDRNVPYQKFVEAILSPTHLEHQSITAQSLMMLPPYTFVELLGKHVFIQNWMMVRDSLIINKSSIKDSAIILNTVWSSMVTGFSFIKPKPSIKKPLSTKLKLTFLEIVSKSKAMSIYEINQNIGRSYNRVYEDIVRLEQLGLVSTNLIKKNNRNVKMVYIDIQI